MTTARADTRPSPRQRAPVSRVRRRRRARADTANRPDGLRSVPSRRAHAEPPTRAARVRPFAGGHAASGLFDRPRWRPADLRDSSTCSKPPRLPSASDARRKPCKWGTHGWRRGSQVAQRRTVPTAFTIACASASPRRIAPTGLARPPPLLKLEDADLLLELLFQHMCRVSDGLRDQHTHTRVLSRMPLRRAVLVRA